MFKLNDQEYIDKTEQCDVMVVRALSGLLVYSGQIYKYFFRHMYDLGYISSTWGEGAFVRLANQTESLMRNSEGTFSLERFINMVSVVFTCTEDETISIFKKLFLAYIQVNAITFGKMQEWSKRGKEIVVLNDSLLSNDELCNTYIGNVIAYKAENLKFFSFEEIEKFKTIKGKKYFIIGDDFPLRDKAHRNIYFKTFIKLGSFAYNRRYSNSSIIARYTEYVYDLADENLRDEEYYKFGLTELGPSLVSFCEWILETAQDNGIKQIFPLLRDGYIISKILERLCEARRIDDIRIEPLHVSRRSLSVSKHEDILNDNIKLNGKMTLGSFFNIFDIDSGLSEDDLSIELNLLKSRKAADGRIYYDIVSEIIDSNQEKIKRDSERKSKEAFLYLSEHIDFSKKYITVDFGFAGTIAERIVSLAKRYMDNINSINLLFFGSSRQNAVVYKKCDVRAFLCNLGLGGANLGYSSYCYCILENLMMNEDGSTVGYKTENNSVVSIQKEGTHVNVEKNRLCHRGIFFYLDQWINLTKDSLYMVGEIHKDRGYYKSVLDRVILYPTDREADAFGKEQYENIFLDGSDETEKICNENTRDIARKTGYCDYLMIEMKNKSSWWSAEYEKLFPGITYSRMLFEVSHTLDEKFVAILLEKIIATRSKRVSIYGFAKKGRMLFEGLKIIGVTVSAIIDNSFVFDGMYFDNIPIISLDKYVEKDIGTVAVCSITYKKEICETLYKAFGKHLSIITV